MKRMTYVDKDGNQINQSFENRKPLLKFFFVFGTILPIVLIILIIATIFQNNHCKKTYEKIKEASLIYAQNEMDLPEIEGENIIVNIGSLYSEQYLKSSETDNILCSGTVKITKYKDEYIYTLDVKNCNSCSTDRRFGNWSTLQTNFPKGKTVIDVIPYYNYYERAISTTKWSKYYDEDFLSDEISEYGVRLPIDMTDIPQIPSESNIFAYETEDTTFFRYRNRSWKWYDIQGNYSSYSSEKPNGFEYKDENTEKYSEWSEYLLNYPEEKSYRRIEQTSGYKYYYVNEKGEKVYFNNGKYTPKEEVNTEKYNERDNETATLYHYRDKMWRWYNGQKRKYSSYSTVAPAGRPYKDAETETLSSWSSWEKARNDRYTEEYMVEENKLMTRFRIRYEILSLKVLEEPLEKDEFETKVNEELQTFNEREDVKLETTYKFRYRKSWLALLMLVFNIN